MPADREELVAWCDERLRAAAFQDVAVNGLQIEGRATIERMAVAVSTSRRTISEAAAWGADALLVHHGLFWGGKAGPIRGYPAERLRLIFRHDLNLIAYHLPLDGHADIGNNVLLARELGLTVDPDAPRLAFVGREPLGVVGEAPTGLSLGNLVSRTGNATNREPIVVGADDMNFRISRVAVLTGSGYGAVQEAADLGCQALVTGDIRESTMAEAREVGLAVIAAGHEATERLGVQALAAALANVFGIEYRFIADPNPV
jgi:dinuclear metal center YbgI/SA1388 family protein